MHGNLPIPGRYRICLVGGLATKLRAAGGAADLDITFTTEKAWEDPGQKPYSATNMKFFDSLGGHMAPGQLVSVTADQILSGAVNLDRFSSLVVADDAFPGYVEPIPTGPAQGADHFPGRGGEDGARRCRAPTSRERPTCCRRRARPTSSSTSTARSTTSS